MEAAVPLAVLAASTHKRLIFELDCWPWRLMKLLLPDDDVSAAEKREIIVSLQHSQECCIDNVSEVFKDMCPVNGEMPAEVLTRLRDVFETASLTNVRSECQFASARVLD
eukprot:132987-Pyramimonas_sp.AAC.1